MVGFADSLEMSSLVIPREFVAREFEFQFLSILEERQMKKNKICYTAYLIFLCLTVLVPAATARDFVNRQLSDLQSIEGDVKDYLFTPDDSLVIFTSDRDDNNQTQLFSVPAAGGVTTELSPSLNGMSGVDSFRISPDGGRVVYCSEQDTDGFNDLFSVPVVGGSSVKLNDLLLSNQRIDSYEISPDSSMVVFLVSVSGTDEDQLFSIPIGGGSVTRLNDDLPQNVVMGGFSIAPDSARVVYYADQETPGVFELYSVPIGGGSTTHLNDNLPNGGRVYSDFQLYTDGGIRVLYRGDLVTDTNEVVFSVPIGGGTPRQENDTLDPNDDVRGMLVSDDGSWIVYLLWDNSSGAHNLMSNVGGVFAAIYLQVSNVMEAFQISPDSTLVAYLAADNETGYLAPKGGGVLSVLGDVTVMNIPMFHFTPDSARVVFLSDRTTEFRPQIYSAGVPGGTPIPLNDEPTFEPDRLELSVAGSTVFFRTDNDIQGETRFFAVPADGSSAPVVLNGTMVDGGNVNSFLVSSSGARAAYRADQDTNQINELYSVFSSGTDLQKLSDPINALGGDVNQIYLSQDETTVLFIGEQEVTSRSELFTVPVAGGTPQRINGDLNHAAADLTNFWVSPDENHVIYMADRDLSDVYHLYRVGITGGAVTQLSGVVSWEARFGSWSELSRTQVNSTSTHVVYLAQIEFDENPSELYSVPIGGGSPVMLNLPFEVDSADSVNWFGLTPDGQRVVFSQYDASESLTRIYSIAIAGGSAAELTPSLTVGSEPDIILISSDSANVVFMINPLGDGNYQLYRSDLTGTALTQLNDVGSGDGIRYFEIAPDDLHVVFVGTDNALHRNTMAGGEATNLAADIETGWHRAFAVSPDSSTVAYFTSVGSPHRLLSVALAGGPSVPLSGDLSAGPSMEEGDEYNRFAFTEDSKRVVFLAQGTDDTVDIYTVLAAGGSPVRLSPQLPTEHRVLTFLISSDSQSLMFQSGDNDPGEIYWSSIRGELRNLMHPTMAGSNIVAYPAWTAGDNVLVYGADQDIVTLQNVYASEYMNDLLIDGFEE